jgi:hypothetical protein
VAQDKAPQAAILFDKFHIMRHLGEALDKVRKTEYARLHGKDRRFIKGQKYTLLSHRDNLTLDGKRSFFDNWRASLRCDSWTAGLGMTSLLSDDTHGQSPFAGFPVDYDGHSDTDAAAGAG